MKFIKSLSLKKNREKEGLFIAEGDKIVNELIDSQIKIHSLYFTDDWKNENVEHKNSTDFFEVSEEGLKKISLLETPNKVLAVAQIPAYKLELKNLTDKFTLILDDIQDPGNMGTIIRTTDWFGIKNIICSEQTVDVFNSKVVQASMGSLFRTKVFYENLKEILTIIKEEIKLPVYGAVLNGENIFSKKLNIKGFLLMGNESKGINKELYPFIDEKISLPAAVDNAAESLNVAIATSILCYEFHRHSLKAG